MLVFGPQIHQRFPIPASPYRPGENERPTENLLVPVQATVDIRVTEENWEQHSAYLYGFVLYRSGYYWEAHEIWEPVWMRCAPNSVERLLLQVIIQLANAALKGSQGNDKASVRLRRIALGQLREVLSRHQGIDRGPVVLGIDLDSLEHQLR